MAQQIERIPFDTDTLFRKQMAIGHLDRKRHKLEGYYVKHPEDGLMILVRTCCGETEPKD